MPARTTARSACRAGVKLALMGVGGAALLYSCAPAIGDGLGGLSALPLLWGMSNPFYRHRSHKLWPGRAGFAGLPAEPGEQQAAAAAARASAAAARARRRRRRAAVRPPLNRPARAADSAAPPARTARRARPDAVAKRLRRVPAGRASSTSSASTTTCSTARPTGPSRPATPSRPTRSTSSRRPRKRFTSSASRRSSTSSRNKLWERMRIPPAWGDYITTVWRRTDPTLVGRFDLAYDGKGPPKLLEYNADTPTALYEAAVVQWYWLKDVKPDADQFNSIHERLIEAWRGILEAALGRGAGAFRALRGPAGGSRDVGIHARHRPAGRASPASRWRCRRSAGTASASPIPTRCRSG